MPSFSDEKIEQKFLAMLLMQPYHLKLLTIDENIFFHSNHIELAKLMKKFVREYRSKPTKDSLVIFANDTLKDKNDMDKMSEALMILDHLPEIDINEFNFCLKKLEDYKIGRDIYDIAVDIRNTFENNHEINYRSLRQKLMRDLMKGGFNEDHIIRGHLYDSVEERWNLYRDIVNGTTSKEVIPFGIKAIDEKLGGMHRTFLTLLYSRTGGGKTRTSINIAYNVASLGYNVMYISLEMKYDLIASCFDSRIALVDSHKIIYGKLGNVEKSKFKSALKKQLMDKLNIWLVDNPANATPNFINEEIEIYRTATGKDPDLIVIDYANLMQPNSSFVGRSEKYDHLFKELHETARFHNVALLTSTVESRDRSKADKNKKNTEDDEEIGVEGIGLSNAIAYHCEIVARLKQDKYDALQRILKFIVEKSRYGKSFEVIKLRALWDISYVGDDTIPGTEGLGTKKYKLIKTADD